MAYVKEGGLKKLEQLHRLTPAGTRGDHPRAPLAIAIAVRAASRPA